MINWRSIEKDGMPTNPNVGYLVSDGETIEYSDINIRYYNHYDITPQTDKKIASIRWVGGSVFALYEEVSGTEFDYSPTHWCPVNELNLPK